MNKELSPLEAFAKVKDRLEIWDCGEESNWEEYGTGYYECEEELGIIETALKKNQTYEEVLQEYGFTLVDFREACFLLKQFRESGFIDIEKKDKALKTIVAKRIDFDKLSDCCNYIEYNTEIDIENEEHETTRQRITSEEYDMFDELGLIY